MQKNHPLLLFREPLTPLKHFSARDLDQRLREADNPDPILLDVREPWEFDICAIPDSVLIPMGKISQQLDSLDKDAEIVVICHHGIRSRSIALYMEQQGFRNMINLSGGVEAWAREVDIDMPTY